MSDAKSIPTHALPAVLVSIGLAHSQSAARRLIMQGAVRVKTLPNNSVVVVVGKTHCGFVSHVPSSGVF